jgi:hypothetical protein
MNIGEKTMKILPPKMLVSPTKITPVIPKARIRTLCDGGATS